MFQLNEQEFENWKSQIVISNPSFKMVFKKKTICLYRAWHSYVKRRLVLSEVVSHGKSQRTTK